MVETPVAARTPVEPPRLAAAYALGIVGVVIFGATLPATRLALGDFSPWFITFARAAIAASCALAVLVLLRRPFRHPANPSLFAAGLLLIFGFPGFMALAMQYVPASFGGVVLGFLPLATAILAAAIDSERHGKAFWALSVAGGLVIAAYMAGGDAVVGQMAGADAGEVALGNLFLLLSVLCAAAGYVISGRQARGIAGWEVICRALVLNAPLIAIGTVATWDPAFASASAIGLAAMAYLGFGSMFVGFFAWNKALALGGIGRIGQVQLLQTFVTIALSAWLLGEAITPLTLLAAVAITAIIALTRRL